MAPVPVGPSELEVIEAIYRYISPALTCGRVPVFGSAEWAMLGDDDPAKHAAVVRAALAHWNTAQVEAENRVQASHAISAAYDWAGEANRPSRAQVLRWREARSA